MELILPENCSNIFAIKLTIFSAKDVKFVQNTTSHFLWKNQYIFLVSLLLFILSNSE